MGYLEGQVTIGPLQPVERVGVPPPTPSPAVCTARGLVVYQADTGAEAARFPLGPDCHYRVALPASNYRVELDRRGIDFSKDLPRVVTITAGQTTQLDPQHRYLREFAETIGTARYPSKPRTRLAKSGADAKQETPAVGDF